MPQRYIKDVGGWCKEMASDGKDCWLVPADPKLAANTVKINIDVLAEAAEEGCTRGYTRSWLIIMKEWCEENATDDWSWISEPQFITFRSTSDAVKCRLRWS